MNLFYIYIQIFLCIPKMFDSVHNITDYTDYNMLLAVHILLPNADSKDFVDRPTKITFTNVLNNFKKIEKALGLERSRTNKLSDLKVVFEKNIKNFLGNDVTIKKVPDFKTVQERNSEKVILLKKFIEENYGEPGSDITFHVPEDYSDDPKFIKALDHPELIEISQALNKKWKELSRRKKVFDGNEESTLLDLPYPFIIPGGRFREYYYWDTYWILEGLIICDMDKTAVNVLKNFIHVIKTLGYIPNGLRKYYLYRSQQPYFPMMLLKLYKYKGGLYDDLILGEGLNMATREYEFFEKYRTEEVEGRDKIKYKLNLHHVSTDFPRPESFGEDLLTCKNQSKLSKEAVYSNLKSAAETGWDFSSRWLIEPTNLSTAAAYDQISADLNAVIYRNEKILEMLWNARGDKEMSKKFREKAARRHEAINQVLWNPQENMWNDYNLITKKHVTHRFYISNIIPMIYGINPPDDICPYEILLNNAKDLFGYPGGIPASGPGPFTEQQWDWPNVWAPHQHMFVEYLLQLDEREMALHAARNFYRSISIGYKNDGEFYEKYDCNKPGYTGAGGEYAPQTGFGWTNGTSLSFINTFQDDLLNNNDHATGYKNVVQLLHERITESKNKTEESKEETNPLDLMNAIFNKMSIGG